ncbi:MAG: hypothetical protein IPH04_01145 [Saprospirales bacterium]|nr:hypothetical protein [Saprospirales bacterium]
MEVKSLSSLLPEQHRITAKIEELFSELDNGIANLKKAQAQLKVYRQAVLKAAFEGKLTEQWREQQRAAGNLPFSRRTANANSGRTPPTFQKDKGIPAIDGGGAEGVAGIAGGVEVGEAGKCCC